MRLLSVLVALILFATQSYAGGKRVAVLGVTLIDTSTEGAINGVRADETQRLGKFDAQLRAAFEAAGYDLVDLEPIEDDLDNLVNPAQCNDCELKLARRLDADLVVTSEVQKISNLILAFNVVVRDVESGKRIRVASADIRGNNDRSWERGLSWILRNRILKEKP